MFVSGLSTTQLVVSAFDFMQRLAALVPRPRLAGRPDSRQSPMTMGFGGVGPSGMGRHQGEEGFREFSNPRGFFERKPGSVLDWFMPPYGRDTRRLIDDVACAPLGKQLRFALPRLVKSLLASRL